MCRSSYSEKRWRSSFYQNKVVLKKWQHARREIAIWKKRNQIRLPITFNFPQEVPSPLKVFKGNLIWILTRVAGLKKCLNSRSSHKSCSIEKAVLKNFAIFTGKHLCWSLLLIDLQASKPATFFKRDSSTSVFLWILQNFWEHLFCWKSANNCFCSFNFLLIIFLLGCLFLLLIQ